MPARLRWSSSASPISRSGSRRQPAYRLVGVPVGAEQVRAEVADGAVLAVAREQLDHRQPVADRLPLGGRQQQPAPASRGRRATGRRAGRGATLPSIRKWVCRVRSPSTRVSRCLPRG